MTYQVDYIHMRNVILRAIESIAAKPAGADNRADSYGEMISFLEEMYVNSVLALAGSLLAVAKYNTDQQETTDMLAAARSILELPAASVQEMLDEKYGAMIRELNLPDAYQTKTSNEKLVDEIIAEQALNEAKQSDSQ